MQVSRLDDKITHAVIGHQESTEMGVSDSAALMHILSSALYTHPKLAVVREIMCNGWDAHISAGIDTPLDVVLTDSQLSIRDYGLGIPHDKIGAIYGTYGGSTKRDDSTVTGGFGLGSKAPFAYVDNFEVISYHEGTMTVYRVSKSSMEVGGKPSINKVVSVPTTETGIKVSLSINAHHKQAFDQHIYEIRMMGEIPVNLNGIQQSDPFPLSKSPTGYLVTQMNGTITSRINVRYGNVVYPFPKAAEYGDDYDRVMSGMRNLTGHWNVTFLAPPDAIAIAPSREALNLTPLTVKTLGEMLKRFDPQIAKQVDVSFRQVHQKELNKLIKDDTTMDKLFTKVRYLDLKDHISQTNVETYAFTLKKAALNYKLQTDRTEYHQHDLAYKRIKRLITLGKVPGKFAKALLKRYDSLRWSKHRRNAPRGFEGVIHRYVTQHVMAMINANDKLNVDRLSYTNIGMYGSMNLYKPKRYDCNDLATAAAYMEKKILIVRSNTAAEAFFKEQCNYGHVQVAGWLVYMVTNNEKVQALVISEFEKLGYQVENRVPVREVIEVDGVKIPKPAKPSKKRVGYLTLRDSRDYDSRFLLNHAREVGKPATAVHDPLAYVVLNAKHEGPHSFSNFSSKESQVIDKMWGDRIAVVTSVQVEVMKVKGVPSVSDFVNGYVDDTLSASPNFRRYLAYGQYFDTEQHRPVKLLRAMNKHESLMLACGLRFALTAETEMLLTFFENSKYTNAAVKTPKCHELKAKVKKSPMVEVMQERLDKSPYANYLNITNIVSVLEAAVPDSANTEIPYELVRKLLK